MNPTGVKLTELEQEAADDDFPRWKIVRFLTDVSHDERFDPKPLHIDADDSEVSI